MKIKSLGAENLLQFMFKDCGMLVERYAQTIAFCCSGGLA
jgi:hypothetical protein